MKMAQEGKQRPLGKWAIRLIQGMLIGGGAILPGVSGGVLCVAFGFYPAMMAVLAHPFRNLPRYYKMFLPIVMGWLAGFFAFAKVIELFFSFSEIMALWLFIGLILGTMPSLFSIAGKEGRPRCAYVAGFFSFAVFFVFMVYIQKELSANIHPNVWWFLFCGLLWGLSLVMPGMTSSSILISMGLFLPMTTGIASFDWGVLVPLLAGISLVVLLTARLVNLFFERYYAVAYHSVLGLVLASTVVIVPLSYQGIGEVFLALLCCIFGFAVAWAMEKYAKDE